jgi:adenine-specific DNA-methyltransferase
MEARKLMKDDGLIFIQIDDAQHAYLRVLCDEVFEENFITSISVQMSTASGLKISHKEKKILKIKEHVLVYAKNKNNVLFNPIYIPKKEWDDGYNFYLEKNNSDSVNKWQVKNLDDVLKENGIETKDINDPIFKKFYLENKDLIWGRGRHHNIPKDIFELSMKHRDNVFKYGEGDEKNYAYRGRRLAFLSKTINKCLQEDGSYKEDLSVLLCDFWNDINTAKLFNEGGVEFPNGKKPEQLLQRIIYLSTDENDIVLDFFFGSGGTGAVAHKTNRQYIGIEQLDYENNDSVKRLNNVIRNDDLGGITKGVNWHGGGDFVYIELAKWNEEAKEKIVKAKNLSELEKLFDEIYEKYFLNYNVKAMEFKKKIIKEEGFKKLSLNEQKKLFVEMLDMNQMYVNFSERADKKYNLSKEDIALSEEFYNAKK